MTSFEDEGPAGAVVVGVDDGLLRLPILDRAVALARQLGRGIRVVHGHGRDGETSVWTDDAGLRAESYLRRNAPGLAVHRTCAEGDDAAKALVAASETAPLLVLGDRRRRLGSEAGRTTDEVMGRASCPVLVIGEYRDDQPSGALGGRGVVAGVDGSRHGAVVLNRALEAAEMLGSPLEAIRVCEDIASTDGELVRREVDAEDLSAAHRDLDALVDACDGHGVPTSTRTVADRPARALLAAGRDAGLIVLGHRAHDDGQLARLGSTASAVLAAAPCPVLVVGPGAASQLDVPLGGPVDHRVR